MPLVVNDELSWKQTEISFGITGRRGSGTVMVPPPEIASLQCALHEGSSCFDPLPMSPPWWDLVRHAAAKIVGREAFTLASLAMAGVVNWWGCSADSSIIVAAVLRATWA